jgi:hypothetical protein
MSVPVEQKTIFEDQIALNNRRAESAITNLDRYGTEGAWATIIESHLENGSKGHTALARMLYPNLPDVLGAYQSAQLRQQETDSKVRRTMLFNH